MGATRLPLPTVAHFQVEILLKMLHNNVKYQIHTAYVIAKLCSYVQLQIKGCREGIMFTKTWGTTNSVVHSTVTRWLLVIHILYFWLSSKYVTYPLMQYVIHCVQLKQCYHNVACSHNTLSIMSTSYHGWYRYNRASLNIKIVRYISINMVS